MSSKKLVASVVVVLVGSPFAVAALEAIGIGPNWQEEAPVWEAGYSWTFENSMQGEIKEQWNGVDGSREVESDDYEVRGQSKRTVLNTTAQIGNTSLYAVVEQWAPKSGSDMDMKGPVDDGAPVQEGTEEVTSCIVECPVNHGYYTKSDINPFYESGMSGQAHGEQLRLLDFPLRPGATWSVYRNDQSMDLGPGMVEELQARVAGKDLVNLPGLGSMDAIRIEATYTKETRDAFEESMDMFGAMDMESDMDLDYRLTYWYAPEAKSIVRVDLDQHLAIKFAFNGVSASMEHTHRSQEILSDYSLRPTAEKSLDDTRKLRAYLEDLPDVTQLSNETWPFNLAHSHSQVNVNDGETATLGLVKESQGVSSSTRDFDEIPPGMQVKWRHRYLEIDESDLEGKAREDWYAGDTLELSPQTQGLHEVVAYLLDDEKRLVALDSTIIEGYGEWDVDGASMVGVFGGVGGHASVDFWTNLMLDHIHVAVDPGIMGAGTIYANSEHNTSSYPVTGEDSAQFDHGHPELGNLWRVGFTDFARVGELDMTVTARYDRSLGVDGFDSIWTDLAEEPSLGETRSDRLMCTGIMTSCLAKGLVERFEARALDGAFPADSGSLGLPGWH